MGPGTWDTGGVTSARDDAEPRQLCDVGDRLEQRTALGTELPDLVRLSC